MDQAFEDKVVQLCNAHESAHEDERDYRAAIYVDSYFVKFGDIPYLSPEIATQKYLSDYATSNPGPGVPRIPRVQHSFQRGITAYLVIEFIQLQPISAISDEVTAALVWLASVPPPTGHVMGPVGGGPIRHGLFKGATAPLQFSSVEALERYINKGCTLLPRSTRQLVPPVKIQNDRLIFSQADMHDSNFALDDQGRTVLLDFAEIGLFPETLVAYTLAFPRLAPIAAALRLSKEHVPSISRISSVLKMVSNPKLGLDDDGNPEAKRQMKAIVNNL